MQKEECSQANQGKGRLCSMIQCGKYIYVKFIYIKREIQVHLHWDNPYSVSVLGAALLPWLH
jgi:hypothetical protein